MRGSSCAGEERPARRPARKRRRAPERRLPARESDDTLDAIAARLARERPAEIELVCAVSNEGRLLGTLPVRKLFGSRGSKSLAEVLRREHVEDLHRFAGIQRETSLARHAIDEAIAVRGLSLTRSGITHLLAAELGVGTLIGAALGALAMPLV